MRSPPDPSGAFDPDAVAVPPAVQPAAKPAERRGRRLGVAIGAAAAALASAGLVYWIGAGEDHGVSAPRGAAPHPPRAAYAPLKPDAEQVARAYDQLQQIYADQGEAGMVDFARACAASLRSDPGVLDFCLAFDIYAAELGGDDEAVRDWRAQAETRDLALARSVLPPGQDPARRLAEVRTLARRTSLETPGVAPPAVSPGAPAQPAAPPAQRAPPHEAAAPVRHASAAGVCRAQATPGRRAVCASPALREADRRLRQAYRRALEAGASPNRLAHDQARFRAAVDAAAPDRAAIARLYHRRIQALELLVRRPRPSAG